MTAGTVPFRLSKRWLATVVCCAGILVTGLSLDPSVFALSIAAAICFGLLSYGVSVFSSRIETAKILFFNSGLLALVFVLLRVVLNSTAFRFPPVYWPWFHRIFRAWWLSECSAIILALLAVGLVAIEVASKIGGDTTRRRFQWCIITTASILVVVNITHFLRPASCADCFFPYGLPFTLFTEGGFAGGGGIVLLGLVADAALIPLFAAFGTLLWNKIAVEVV